MDLGELVVSDDAFEEGNQASITQMGWGWWLVWISIIIITISVIAWSIFYVHQHRKRLLAKCQSGDKRACGQLVFNVN